MRELERWEMVVREWSNRIISEVPILGDKKNDMVKEGRWVSFE